jgi:hypothetical protein
VQRIVFLQKGGLGRSTSKKPTKNCSESQTHCPVPPVWKLALIWIILYIGGVGLLYALQTQLDINSKNTIMNPSTVPCDAYCLEIQTNSRHPVLKLFV